MAPETLFFRVHTRVFENRLLMFFVIEPVAAMSMPAGWYGYRAAAVIVCAGNGTPSRSQPPFWSTKPTEVPKLSLLRPGCHCARASPCSSVNSMMLVGNPFVWRNSVLLTGDVPPYWGWSRKRQSVSVASLSVRTFAISQFSYRPYQPKPAKLLGWPVFCE